MNNVILGTRVAISGGPNVAPVEHPLIVARTAEEWFEPESQGR